MLLVNTYLLTYLLKLYLVSGKHFNDKKDNKKFQIYLLKYKFFFFFLLF